MQAALGFAGEFGDGGEGSGSAPTYAYDESGRYDVTVTVMDNGGCTDSQTKTLTVQP